MNLAEWHAYIASAPATPGQVGAIHQQAERLGLCDRAERLAACAALLGLGGLGSTRDLSQGDAGKLVRILRGIRDPAALPRAGQLGDQADEPPAVPIAAAPGDALLRLALVLQLGNRAFNDAVNGTRTSGQQ